jgi:predicted phage terminase large subunit-like protein
LHATAIDHALRWFPTAMIIEDQGTGTALIQDLGRIGSPGFPMPIAITPEGDKITRMHSQALKIESGQVYLPEQAPWLEDFRTELLQFPKGRFDDQVDSLSQALGWLGMRSEVSFSYCFLN